MQKNCGQLFPPDYCQASATSVMSTKRSSPPLANAAQDPAGEEPIESLANLGPRSAAFLHTAGIRTRKDLAALGSVAAYARVKRVEPKASLNLLWALEGSLTGQHWRAVSKEHRTSLLLALESHELQSRTKSSKT
jgi:DNA transformation protein